jgi:hypothetical protein
MTPTARTTIAAILTIGVLLAGCAAQTSAHAVRVYEPSDATFVPFAVSESTSLPTETPGASYEPTATPATTFRPTPRPTKAPAISSTLPRVGASVTGVATWYCEPGVSICTAGYSASGAYGAAGPALRRALGRNWRGRTVYVNGVTVRLIDWCFCGGGHVIDVYHSTWLRIPHPDRVTIRW